MQSGIAPPHGFALSIFRSKNTVSIFFSCAKISAAQAPDGPPPTTATLYFISNMVVDDDEALVGIVICLPTKLDDIVKAEADTTSEEIAANKNFMMYCTYKVYTSTGSFVICNGIDCANCKAMRYFH